MISWYKTNQFKQKDVYIWYFFKLFCLLSKIVGFLYEISDVKKIKIVYYLAVCE